MPLFDQQDRGRCGVVAEIAGELFGRLQRGGVACSFDRELARDHAIGDDLGVGLP